MTRVKEGGQNATTRLALKLITECKEERIMEKVWAVRLTYNRGGEVWEEGWNIISEGSAEKV